MEGLGLVSENLGLLPNANFLPFLFARLEAIDSISLIFVLTDMLTVLNGLEIFSIPEMSV